jgi:hypothetical protein
VYNEQEQYWKAHVGAHKRLISQFLWYLEFSQRSLWTLQFSWMWCRVVQNMFTDLFDEHTAFIFWVEQ